MLKQRFWKLFRQHNDDFILERRETAARWMARARMAMDVSEDEGEILDAALAVMWSGLDSTYKMSDNEPNP
jgi:hypothetical protein